MRGISPRDSGRVSLGQIFWPARPSNRHWPTLWAGRERQSVQQAPCEGREIFRTFARVKSTWLALTALWSGTAQSLRLHFAGCSTALLHRTIEREGVAEFVKEETWLIKAEPPRDVVLARKSTRLNSSH